MQFSELLDKIRSHYVERLLAAITEARAAEDVTIVHEPALRDGKGEITRSGHLDTPLRVDIVTVRDGEVIDSLNVDTEEMPAFEPFMFSWPNGDLSVTIEPFQWNWLQVLMAADPSPDDWRAIRDWYLQWFGETDPAPETLSGAVHFIDDPNIKGPNIQLTIDLGTAPIECFEELLDALSKFGAEDVFIGQFPT